MKCLLFGTDLARCRMVILRMVAAMGLRRVDWSLGTGSSFSARLLYM